MRFDVRVTHKVFFSVEEHLRMRPHLIYGFSTEHSSEMGTLSPHSENVVGSIPAEDAVGTV